MLQVSQVTSHHMMSHDGSHDKFGKVVHRPCNSCISSIEKPNRNSIKFSLSIAEQRAVGFILAWSLAFLHYTSMTLFSSHFSVIPSDYYYRLRQLYRPPKITMLLSQRITWSPLQDSPCYEYWVKLQLLPAMVW